MNWVNTAVLLCILGCLSVDSGLCGTNHMAEMMKFPDARGKIAYVQSIDRQAVMLLASQAYAAGWDDHAVAVGIVGPAWEKQPPTAGEICAVITNREMHPRLRIRVARGGLGQATDWETGTLLQFADDILTLIRDPGIPYVHKQGLAGRYCRYVGERMTAWKQRNESLSSGQQVVLEKLLRHTTCVLKYLAGFVMNAPDKMDDQDRSLSSACVDLIECIGFCSRTSFPDSDATRGALEATREGREALVHVLTDEVYPESVARLILRRHEQASLDDVMPAQAVAEIKKDKRFTGEEDQRLLDALHQRIVSKSTP